MSGKIQSDLIWCVHGLTRTSPDYYAASVANMILGRIGLGGRLGDNVRERQGLAYYCGSSLDADLGAGPWAALAGINPANVERAHAFLEKNGPKTIVLARFVPVVRTFAPIVAGVGKMKYRTFVTYNVVGGLLWGAGVTTLGHFLGTRSWVKDNIEVASVVIVAISLLPVAIEFLRHRRATVDVIEDIAADITSNPSAE